MLQLVFSIVTFGDVECLVLDSLEKDSQGPRLLITAGTVGLEPNIFLAATW